MNQDKNISLELSIEEVNNILAALGNLPYAQVFGLIQKIQQQAGPQIQKAEFNGKGENQGKA